MVQNTYIIPIFILLIPICIVYYALLILAKDKYFNKFFVLSLLGGLLSAITAKYFAYQILEMIVGQNIFYVLRDTNNSILHQIILNLCFVGIIEEGIKLFYTILVLVYFQRLSSFISYLVASIGVASGFTILENVHYFEFYGYEAIYKRATISFAGHIAFSSIAGISLGISIYYSTFKPYKGYFIFLFGFILSALMHSVFNVIASSFELENAIVLLLILLFVVSTLLVEGWHKLLKIDRISNNNHNNK